MDTCICHAQTHELLSAISPLNWGLEGFYDLFIRNGNLRDILPECIVSVVFAGLCVFIALFYHKKKRVDL
jgi:ABC-2 type transport system permease protein